MNVQDQLGAMLALPIVDSVVVEHGGTTQPGYVARCVYRDGTIVTDFGHGATREAALSDLRATMVKRLLARAAGLMLAVDKLTSAADALDVMNAMAATPDPVG